MQIGVSTDLFEKYIREDILKSIHLFSGDLFTTKFILNFLSFKKIFFKAQINWHIQENFYGIKSFEKWVAFLKTSEGSKQLYL